MATALATPPLLPTKLFVPVLGREVLARRRLHELLGSARGTCMVLVSAPAGSGKTTLIADWIRDAGHAAGWISLDEGDDDPASFLGYLIEAVQALDGGGVDRAHTLLRSTPFPEPRVVAAALVADLVAADCAGVIVLDDYHAISDPAIHEILALLVERAPPSLVFVVISRSDPPLPIARLRAGRKLVEVREAELRFEPDEAAALLANVCGREFRRESVAALAGRTEGWAAGLQLAALALRRAADPDAFIAEFQGTHAFVADYLADEVLAGIPEEHERFLVRSSLLDRLTGPLCDEALGRAGSRALLEELSRANLFLVPLDGERRWFRYHHLFADLLRRRGHEVDAAERCELLLRAAAWCERNGVVDDAVAYAVRAGNPGQAADLVARHGIQALAAGEAHRALRWIRQIPDEVVRSSPDHCVIAAWSYSLVDRHDAMAGYAARARDLAARGERPYPYVEHVGLHARVLLAGTDALEGAGPDAALHALDLALDEIPAEDLLLRASAEVMTGKIQALAGRYAAAHAAHDRAFALGARAESELLRLAAVSGRAEAFLLEGRLRQAIATVDAELAGRHGLREILGCQMANLCTIAALAHLERNDLDGADRTLRKAWAALGAGEDSEDAWRGVALLGGARLTAFHSTAASVYYGLSVYIGLLIRRGALADAERRLDEIEAALAPATRPTDRVAIDALRVRLWCAAAERTRLQRWTPARTARSTGCAYWDDVDALTRARAALAAGDPDSARAHARPLLDRGPRQDAFIAAADTAILEALAHAASGRHADEARCTDVALEMTSAEDRRGAWLDAPADALPLLRRALARSSAAGPALAHAAELVALLEAQRQADPMHGPDALSERELAVLRLLAAGHTNPQIADTLFLAVGTVKKHTHNIFGKLGVRNRTQAVQAARERGLLP